MFFAAAAVFARQERTLWYILACDGTNHTAAIDDYLLQTTVFCSPT